MNKRQRKKYGIVPHLTWQRKWLNAGGVGYLIPIMEDLYARMRKLGASGELANDLISFHCGHSLDFYHYYPDDIEGRKVANETIIGLKDMSDEELMHRLGKHGSVSYTYVCGRWVEKRIGNQERYAEGNNNEVDVGAPNGV